MRCSTCDSPRPGDANLAVEHAHAGGAALEARQNLFAKERFQFARWARQQHNEVPAVFQPQARRRAARILQDFCAFRNHRLAHIDLGHFAVQSAKASLDVTKDVVVAQQFAAQKFRNSFAREVVLGGAKSARCDHELHAIQRVAKCLAQQIAVVADNRLSHHLNANFVQLLRQEERIGVKPVRREQLRTHCDYFRFHRVNYPRSGKPRTSQSSVKSAPVVARIARPEDCSAMPTRPEPLRTTSAWACGLMRIIPRRPP